MNWEIKHTISLTAAIAVIIGWNYFLIQRDAKIFGTSCAQMCGQQEARAGW